MQHLYNINIIDFGGQFLPSITFLLSGASVVALIELLGPMFPSVFTAAMLKEYMDEGYSLVTVNVLSLFPTPCTFISACTSSSIL